jgi:predicted MFS family arabinose efflux permease
VAGSATAAYISGTVVGGFSGRAVTGGVAAMFNWPEAFVTIALMNAAMAVILWRWLPRERERPRAPRAASRLASTAGHLRSRQLAASYAIGVCVLFTQVALFTYVTFVLAAAPYDLSPAELGALFVTYLVGAAITPLAGRFMDAYGHRAALALAIGIGVCGSLLTLARPLSVIVAGLALAATGVFIAQATTSSHVASAAERDRGLAVGLYGTFYYAGGAAGGALPAAFWAVGGWEACVALVVFVQVAAIALAFTLWRDPALAPNR